MQGIESGAAESDGDGMISADELHEYAKRHVQSAKPAMKPEIYGIRQGIKIVLSKARVDAKLEYRKWVERYAENGEISFVGQQNLKLKRKELGLSDEVAIAIENEILEPVRTRIRNLAIYEQVLEEACKQMFPLTERTLRDLQDLQESLGLRDKDISAIQERVIEPYKQQELKVEKFRRAELEKQRERNAAEQKAKAKRQSARETIQQRTKKLDKKKQQEPIEETPKSKETEIKHQSVDKPFIWNILLATGQFVWNILLPIGQFLGYILLLSVILFVLSLPLVYAISYLSHIPVETIYSNIYSFGRNLLNPLILGSLSVGISIIHEWLVGKKDSD